MNHFTSIKDDIEIDSFWIELEENLNNEKSLFDRIAEIQATNRTIFMFDSKFIKLYFAKKLVVLWSMNSLNY